MLEWSPFNLSPSRRRRVIACAFGAAIGAFAACGPEAGRDDGALRAKVVAGMIVRDKETRKAIDETAHVSLPSGAGARLSLVVTRARYRLDVLENGRAVKTYPVALGRMPVGAKEREGDQKTPEGDYVLLPHHPSPSFGPCFYVGYPSEMDAARGIRQGLIDRKTGERIEAQLKRGRRPPHDTPLGGLILLHGTRDRTRKHLTRVNWTQGCIAMENRDLEELLAAFARSDRPRLAIRP